MIKLFYATSYSLLTHLCIQYDSIIHHYELPPLIIEINIFSAWKHIWWQFIFTWTSFACRNSVNNRSSHAWNSLEAHHTRNICSIFRYTVFAQLVRVTLLAARFAIFLLDMLAKLKRDTKISTYTSIFAYSEIIQQLKYILQWSL